MINTPEETEKFGKDLNVLADELRASLDAYLNSRDKLSQSHKDSHFSDVNEQVNRSSERIKYLCEEVSQYGQHLINLAQKSKIYRDDDNLPNYNF